MVFIEILTSNFICRFNANEQDKSLSVFKSENIEKPIKMEILLMYYIKYTL